MQSKLRLMSIMVMPLALFVTLAGCQSSEGSGSVDKVKQGLQMAQQGMDDADDAMSGGDHVGLTAAVRMMDQGMAMMQPILDDYIARMKKKGINGKEILDFAIERAAVYSKKYPPGYGN